MKTKLTTLTTHVRRFAYSLTAVLPDAGRLSTNHHRENIVAGGICR